MSDSRTITAREAASRISKAVGRKVTDKQVRAAARDSLTKYDDGRYTAHAYGAADYARLLSIFKGRGDRSKVQRRETVKATSRKRTAAKVPATTTEA